MTRRRAPTAPTVLLGWPLLAGVRVLWLSPSSPLVKVAALVEYPIDVPAVLGHGRWAPYTPRPVELPLAVHRRTLITVEESFGGRVA